MPRQKVSLVAPLLVAGFLLFPISRIIADPLNGSLELGTSVSHFYEARSIFSNPAALGYQTELNGSNFSVSDSYAVNRGYDDSFNLGVTWGYFGFGFEHLAHVVDNYSRYHFGLGFPVYPTVYLGARYSLTRSRIDVVGSPNSLDLGLQFRPSRFFAVGAVATQLNRPVVLGNNLPVGFIFGLTLRPVTPITLFLDADTSSTSFGKTWGYQAGVGLDVVRGLRLSAGYHDKYRFQAGLEIDLGNASVYSTVQPDSREKTAVIGIAASSTPKPSALSPKSALKIKLDSDLVEESTRGGLFLPSRRSLLDVIQTLEKAEKDASVALVVVRIEDFNLGLAAAQELFESLWRLRNSGKKVVAFLGNAGLSEYLIASAADKIYLQTGSQLDFTGLRFERLFFKGTLDKIGVEGEVFAKGKYKSAPEAFTRNESSPPVKAADLEALTEVEQVVVKLLNRGGRINAQKWPQVLRTALYGDDAAKTSGLVDGVVGTYDELEKVTKGLWPKETLGAYRDFLALPPRIAVIVAEGNILKMKGRFWNVSGVSVVSPESMEKKFKEALSDPLTEAIVLRVSSGGGEIAASYEIANLVEKAGTKMPVVVSMGGIAASGGYLISAPASYVFAEPLTLTGSIGVFLGKPNVSGLMEKIGVHKEILSHAPHAGLLSWDRPLSAEGREIMIRQLNHYYDSFVKYVASKRSLSVDKAEEAAQGRVWFGDKAKQHHLVNEMGGYHEAIALAAEKAGLREHYDVAPISEPLDLSDLFGFGSFAKSQGSVLTLLPKEAQREMLWIESLEQNPFLLLSRVEMQ